MDDIQEQLLTEITTLKPTDFVRVVNDPITLPDSAVMQKSKFVDSLFGDVISPVVNGTYNDWAPTGLASAHIIRVLPSGPATITGITTGAIGRVLFLFNVGSSLVRLVDESTLSIAANRISVTGTGNDYMLPADAGVILVYDTTTSRWRVVYSTTLQDGWNPLGGFFTFVSVDGATTVVTCTVDVTSRIQKGTKLRYSQSQGLSAAWNFDGGSASNVGSFTRTDVDMTYTAGKFSNAATFNGTTSKIAITDNVTLKPTGEFTIGLWMKSSNTSAIQGIFQTWSQNTAYAGIALQTNNPTGRMRAYVGRNVATVVGVDLSYFDSVTNVCDGAWHYIVFTFRNNYAQLYVDGMLEGYGYCVTPAYAATNYIRVGCSNGAGTDNQFMNGQVDDLFLINGYALDEATIRAKYLESTAQSTGGFTITKYGIVTDVTPYNGSTTTITFWGGTDFSSLSGTFGTPYFSHAKAPIGFNINPEKWTALYVNPTNSSQASPAQNVAYNLGGSLSIPIGQWYLTNHAALWGTVSAAARHSLKAGLSTVGASSNAVLAGTLFEILAYTNDYVGYAGTGSNVFTCTAKTTVYFNVFTGTSGLTSVQTSGNETPTTIKAVSVYL